MRLSTLLLPFASAAVFDEMEADYTVVVPAGVQHCYFQPMTKGTVFEIEYQVLEGGDLDINFSLGLHRVNFSSTMPVPKRAFTRSARLKRATTKYALVMSSPA